MAINMTLPEGTVTIAQCPFGEYFKKSADAKRVWVRGAYNRTTKRYECCAADDINQFSDIPGNRKVYVGFTY